MVLKESSVARIARLSGNFTHEERKANALCGLIGLRSRWPELFTGFTPPSWKMTCLLYTASMIDTGITTRRVPPV